MKKLEKMTKKRFRLIWIFSVLFLGMAFIFTACQKDDEIESLVNEFQTGSAKLNTNDDWNFDKAHSNVRWETLYMGKAALLTGRFNNFKIDINFDEANPASGKIEASVVLNSVHSGENGRDRLDGCLQRAIGVVHNGDTLANGNLDPAGIVANTNVATFTSKSIEIHGDGYLAKGDFTFNGVSKTEELYFDYLGTETISGGDALLAGFYGFLTINAISEYGVNSTNIADKVTIRVEVQLKKTL